jgi:hypothetical protein
MFYIYGAKNSLATEKAENLLIICQKDYKTFILGKDYTIQQLHRLIPETNHVPHIYDGPKYIGGLKELYDYLYTMIKFDEERNDEK